VDPALITNVLAQFESILLNLVKPHDGAQVGDLLGLLNPRDELLIRYWNKDSPQATSATIYSLVAKQLTQRPDHIAVHSANVSWTYRDVDQLSSDLAITINDTLSGHSDQVIPLCFEKSPWAIIAMLAVAESRSCFCPHRSDVSDLTTSADNSPVRCEADSMLNGTGKFVPRPWLSLSDRGSRDTVFPCQQICNLSGPSL